MDRTYGLEAMITITFRGGNVLSPLYLFEKLGLNIMKASRRTLSLLQMQKVSLKAWQLLPDTGKNPSVIRLSNKQTGATIGAICASSALDGISLITPYTRIKHSFHSCCQSHVLKY